MVIEKISLFQVFLIFENQISTFVLFKLLLFIYGID